jgi:hypothetical protein
MKTSESIAKLAPALLKAQKKIGAAVKGNANPFFKSKYADLGAVMEACKEAFNEAGITVLQPVSSDGTKHFVQTILIHESGEFISDSMMLELGKTDMQQLGSAITYARRYSLQSMGFIPAEDDDGEAAMNRKAAANNTVTAAQAAGKASVTTSVTAAVVTPAVAAASTGGFRPGRAVGNGAAKPATGGGW